MIVNFQRCFWWLLAHEGGFVNHPEDPGGATNLGVTKAVYEDWIGRSVTIDTIKGLTKEDVEPIYKKRYWNRIKGDLMPSGLDWMLFDWAVNSGPSAPVKTLQRNIGVRVDGSIGPKTMDALSRCDTAPTMRDIYESREAFYRRLSAFPTFGKGWLRRNDETYEQAQSLL